jgi:integrase
MSRRGRGEGTIEQRADGRWHARVSVADGTRKHFYGRTRQEVSDKLTDALAARRKGMLVTSGRRSLADWLEQWLRDYIESFVARTTFERYRGIVRTYIVPALGRKTLEQLSAPQIQRYYTLIKERGYSASTISLHHSVLYHALQDARRAGLVGFNVAEDVKKPPERDRDATHRAFTPEQRLRLEQAIRGHNHESLWLVLLLTGMRIGEAAALTWDDVDLPHSRLIVRKSYRRTLSGPVISEPKTKRGRRTIPLGQTAVAALQSQRTRTREMKLRALQWTNLDLVFPNALGGPLRADKVLLAFKRVLKSAGLPERRLHDLRHTYATDLYAADVHPRSVQELLGHSRLDMTNDLYTGSVPDALRDAVERLDRVRATQAK